jgi:ribosomal protein S27AE
MTKKEDKKVCPKCGGMSWLATSQGAMCKNCGYVQGPAPIK